MPENVEEYILRCNAEGGDGPCRAEFPKTSASGMEVGEVKKKYSRKKNKISPDPLIPVRFRDSSGKEYDLDSFRPEKDEPHFLIPRSLEPGEMVPVRFRDTLQPIDGAGGETFVVGFPPELLEEFQSYVRGSGMMDLAKKLLYRDKRIRPGEQRLYTLDDGNKWSAMVQGNWDTGESRAERPCLHFCRCPDSRFQLTLVPFHLQT